jgi:hypothetical protein
MSQTFSRLPFGVHQNLLDSWIIGAHLGNHEVNIKLELKIQVVCRCWTIPEVLSSRNTHSEEF